MQDAYNRLFDVHFSSSFYKFISDALEVGIFSNMCLLVGRDSKNRRFFYEVFESAEQIKRYGNCIIPSQLRICRNEELSST